MLQATEVYASVIQYGRSLRMFMFLYDLTLVIWCCMFYCSFLKHVLLRQTQRFLFIYLRWSVVS